MFPFKRKFQSKSYCKKKKTTEKSNSIIFTMEQTTCCALGAQKMSDREVDFRCSQEKKSTHGRVGTPCGKYNSRGK